MRPYAFPKSRHILAASQFGRIINGGSYAADQYLVVNCQRWVVDSPKASDRAGGDTVPAATRRRTARIGISIPNKTGSAVIRNRWKRLIRESFRLEQANLPFEMDFIVRPRRGAKPDFSAIRKSIVQLSRRAAKAQIGKSRHD